ncbi:Putative ATP-dependent helicase IRC3 [Lodderomyces elongisporus]|uniref:Putative ATP-dependent helicase IRC3 n=1 Tax=Lodderomyces elongisporus TaxID=36914 RepID=UPI002925D0F9|nr:Putative ATP-dependent helicase IRC3 [Lodderomyces elongisporus]WLF77098.1 Putative ATP-dependent helicase IRC3 [Lodderomyces elongisporus]
MKIAPTLSTNAFLLYKYMRSACILYNLRNYSSKQLANKVFHVPHEDDIAHVASPRLDAIKTTSSSLPPLRPPPSSLTLSRPLNTLPLLRPLQEESKNDLPNTNSELQQLLSRTTPAFKLRDYQVQAIEAIKLALDQGIRRPAVVVATGGGKTVIFSNLIRELLDMSRTETTKSQSQNKRILVLAHTEELIKQAVQKIKAINPELNVRIEMRSARSKDTDDVVVASVMSIKHPRRLARFDPAHFTSIIIDECHHAPAATYQKILNHFGALSHDSHLSVIGFTATLSRFDKRSLGVIFDKVVFQRSLLTMIEAGELVKPVIHRPLVANLNLESVKRQGSDYDTENLYNAMSAVGFNDKAVLSYMRLVEQTACKSTLIFCVNVQHCWELCSTLQSHGINAQYVTGETSKSERAAIVEDFKSGKIPVLCNVEVFTEGTDIPNIDSIILARPTLSRTLVTQSIGRGLRLHKNKTCCHVVDLVDNTIEGIDVLPSLDGDHSQVSSAKANNKEKAKETLESDQVSGQDASKSPRTMTFAERELAVKRILKLHNGKVLTLGEAVNPSSLNYMFQNDDVVGKFMLKNRLPWTMMGYHSKWGLPGRDDRYFILRRVKTDNSNLSSFELSEHRHGSHESKMIYKDVNLLKVLQQLEKEYPFDVKYAESCNNWARRATKKQVAWLLTRLEKNMQAFIREKRMDITVEGFAQRVSHVLSQERLALLTRLFFALRVDEPTYYGKAKINQIMKKAAYSHKDD